MTSALTDGATIQGTGLTGAPIALKQVYTDSTLTGLGTSASPLHAIPTGGGGGGGSTGAAGLPAAFTNAWTIISGGINLGSGTNVASWADYIGGKQLLPHFTWGGAFCTLGGDGVQLTSGAALAALASLPIGSTFTMLLKFRIDANGNGGFWDMNDSSVYHNGFTNGGASVWSFSDSGGNQWNAYGVPSGMLIVLIEGTSSGLVVSLFSGGAWSSITSGASPSHGGGDLWLGGYGISNFGANALTFACAAYAPSILSSSDRTAAGNWALNPVGPPLYSYTLVSPQGTISVAPQPGDTASARLVGIDVVPNRSFPIPYAPNLPVVSERPYAGSTTFDQSHKINWALAKYGHLALEPGNEYGKSDGPPGYDGYSSSQCYYTAKTIIVPRAGTLEGRNSGVFPMTGIVSDLGSSATIWPIWSDGAQQFNCQRLYSIRTSGMGDGNDGCHSVGLHLEQNNRLVAHDIHVDHASEGIILGNMQYGNLYDVHIGSCMIGMTSSSYGGQNQAAGELDVTEWGPFYIWAQKDASDNMQGIGFLQVHDSGTQVRPYRIRGLWLRSQTVGAAICRAPWSRPGSSITPPGGGWVEPYYPGITVDIDGGSSEYNYAGMGGEDEKCVRYTGMAGTTAIATAGPAAWYNVPLGANTGTFSWTCTLGGFLAINPASGQTINTVTLTTARGTLNLLGADAGYLGWGAYNRYPIVPDDVLNCTWTGGATAPQFLVLNYGRFSKIVIDYIRAALFYVDYGMGLQLDNYSMNNSSSMILFQQEDMSLIRLHRIVYGGAGIRGNIARGPNARLEFHQKLPIGWGRMIWENVGKRPDGIEDAGNFGASSGGMQQQQQCAVVASFGIPYRNAEWDVPLVGDAVPAALSGGSGTTWTNNSGFRIKITITLAGATLTAVTVNGIAAGPAPFMDPGDVLSLTFTGGPPTFTYARPTGVLFSPVNAVAAAIPNRDIPPMTASNGNVTVDTALDSDFSGAGETWGGSPPWGQGSARVLCGRLTFHNNAAGHTYKSETDFAYTPYFGGGSTSTYWGDQTGYIPGAATSDSGQSYQLARIYFKLVSTTVANVRLQPHLRSTKGGPSGAGWWNTGCSPMRNSRVRTLTVGASGSTVYSPFAYGWPGTENYGDHPGPNMWGYLDHCKMTFNGFTGLNVTSTSPGPGGVGPPRLQEGVGATQAGPYLVGKSFNDQPSNIMQPDSACIYNYTGSSSPTITAQATCPEGVQLWQGQWTCCDIIWNDNDDSQYAVSLCDIPSGDIQILYRGLLYMRSRPQQREVFNDAMRRGFYW